MNSTVGALIRTILPAGTNEKKLLDLLSANANPSDQLLPWREVPFLPSDLFAVAGYLCRSGGVLGFFDPNPFNSSPSTNCFCLTTDDRSAAENAAASWKKGENYKIPPNYVQELWQHLIGSWEKTVPCGPYIREGLAPAPWWRVTLLLLMVSDMACNRLLQGLGGKAAPQNLFETYVTDLYAHIDASKPGNTSPSQSETPSNKNEKPPASLTRMVDTAIVTVLPKVRVAPVGAALRNVSTNLALLPGRGEVRCSLEMRNSQVPSENVGTLDILLIPAPLSLDASNFESCSDPKLSDKTKHDEMTRWENFRVRQRWIESREQQSKFLNDCVQLVRRAKQEARNVDAVVLPEYSVTYELFDRLCDRLKSAEPDLEFVIAGASSNCDKEYGNQLLTRVWFNRDNANLHLTTSRRKHHRWRLNRSQVEGYALGASLNPRVENWWEDMPIRQRELHFFRFRKASVFSVLICEELARSEPCHEILRSIAPNLVFALLMDGPQIRKRWPYQYASNLADDPGSAVLTLTSYGLVNRSNQQGHHDPNHSIALWKDDTGKVVEIPMPKGEGLRGVLLSLWSEPQKDMTITGQKSDVQAWRYGNHYPILIPAVAPKTAPPASPRHQRR